MDQHQTESHGFISASPSHHRSEDESGLHDETQLLINPFASSRAECIRHRGSRSTLPGVRPIRPLSVPTGTSWDSTMRPPGSQNTTFTNFDPYTSYLNVEPLSNLNSTLGIIQQSVDTSKLKLTTARRESTVRAIRWPPHSSCGQTIMSQDATTLETADFLEMEEEPRNQQSVSIGFAMKDDNNLLDMTYEPIRTSSGLLLTHRRTPPASKLKHNLDTSDANDLNKQNAGFFGTPRSRAGQLNEAFELDSGFPAPSGTFWGNNHTSSFGSSVTFAKAQRLLSFVRLWILLFGMLLVVGTGVAVHSMNQVEKVAVTVERWQANSKSFAKSNSGPIFTGADNSDPVSEQIILVPLPSASKLQAVAKPKAMLTGEGEHQGIRRALRELRQDFDEWVEEHKKVYHSDDEKERRFLIWTENLHRTRAKNQQHGPCKLTKKTVFGSNHFGDLTPEEFQSQYLTGYKGPRTDQLDKRFLRKDLTGRQKTSTSVKFDTGVVPDAAARGDPVTSVYRHLSVQKRYIEHWENNGGGSQPEGSMQKRYVEHWEHDGGSSQSEGAMEKKYIEHWEHNRTQSEGTMEKKYIEHWEHNRSQSEGSMQTTHIEDLGDRSDSWFTPEDLLQKTHIENHSMQNRALHQNEVSQHTEGSQQNDGSHSYKSSYSSSNCEWYDASCWLQWLVNTYGYSIGRTMEPAYDAKSYPSAMDWRNVGAVTSIHSQGNCGACWAITAVETIESAYYISTGNLIDLAESEVIACDSTCEMCNGGWPQNAYEYVMEHKGLPPESSLSYDGDYLLALSMTKSGESDQLSQSSVESYMEATCPSGNKNSNGGQRYGSIKGYGYATNRCVCYTDGSGCRCDNQNEALAVMNLATYGPATVCLDASLWQDYTGGIITSELGCSSAFLDMNHCVQAVGYAYSDGNGDDSNGHSKDGGSNTREGYWIIRNQWSTKWGMSGYAYVAMGENTCGVLNDMTQVYM